MVVEVVVVAVVVTEEEAEEEEVDPSNRVRGASSNDWISNNCIASWATL